MAFKRARLNAHTIYNVTLSFVNNVIFQQLARLDGSGIICRPPRHQDRMWEMDGAAVVSRPARHEMSAGRRWVAAVAPTGGARFGS